MKTVENHIVAFSDGNVDSIVYQHFVSELPLFTIHLIVESVGAAFFYLVEGEGRCCFTCVPKKCATRQYFRDIGSNLYIVVNVYCNICGVWFYYTVHFSLHLHIFHIDVEFIWSAHTCLVDIYACEVARTNYRSCCYGVSGSTIIPLVASPHHIFVRSLQS